MLSSNWEKKRWAAYGLYCLVLISVLLYFRFPEKDVKRFLESQLSEMLPGVEAGLDRIRLVFPLGIELPRVGLSKNHGGEPFFRAEGFTIKPLIRSVLRGKYECSFDCRAYQGRVNGKISVGDQGLKGPLRVHADFKGVRLDDYPWIQKLLSRRVEGSLDGGLTYEGNPRSPAGAKGEANFTLSNGNLGHLQLHPLLKMTAVSFRDAKIHAVLQDQKITVKKAEFGGGQIGGELSGRIHPAADIMSSVIEIRGEIRPSSELLRDISTHPELLNLIQDRMKKGALSLSISGTLHAPNLDLL